MRKRLTKLALLGVLVAIPLGATEFRSPWLSERGPLRYKFEKGNPERYSLDVYGTGYYRESHKAFLSHGTSTKPLTALFFNKADIPLNEIFPGSAMNRNAINYSPFMDLMTIKPRATYYDWGTNLGCRFEYPVFKDKGRVGFRLNVPFRLIEIEREDIRTDDSPFDDFVITRHTQVETGVNSGNAKADVYAKAYNLGFVQHLFEDPGRTKKGFYVGAGASANKPYAFGQQLSGNFLLASNANKTFNQIGTPDAGIIYSQDATGKPKDPTLVTGVALADRVHWRFNTQDQNTAIKQAERKAVAIGNDGSEPSGVANGVPFLREIAFFTTLDDAAVPAARDYTSLNTDQEQLRKMWLVLGQDGGNLSLNAQTIEAGIANASLLYQENPYEWMLNYGNYEFETQRRTGFGDIDLDLFYEHMFSNEWIAEFMLGLRIPTGADDDYAFNPYRAHLGNGEHWEIKLGAMAAWNALNWMNIKLDTYFSFVLKATEKRAAAFEGAKIKNMGPAVDADVDWFYLVARLDFNFFHPKNKNISAVLGYEFYYKTEDDVSFKKSQMTPWGGDHFDGVTKLEENLSNKLAEENTESIAHKVRAEGRYQVNPWFELFAGGSYTFAGKAVARETDVHGGFNVRF